LVLGIEMLNEYFSLRLKQRTAIKNLAIATLLETGDKKIILQLSALPNNGDSQNVVFNNPGEMVNLKFDLGQKGVRLVVQYDSHDENGNYNFHLFDERWKVSSYQPGDALKID
jgi:hypothetical protein